MIISDFARYYPAKNLGTMTTREFFVLLTGLPMNSMWVTLIVRPSTTDGNTGPTPGESEPEVITDPNAADAALWAAFQM